MSKRPMAIVFALAVMVVALSGADRAEADHWLPIFGDTVVCSVEIDDLTLVAPVEMQAELESLTGEVATTSPFHQVVESCEATSEIHVFGGCPECDGALLLWIWGFSESGSYASSMGDARVYVE